MAKLAIAGGTPIRERAFRRWPFVTDNDREKLSAVFNSGKWHNGEVTDRFSRRFAARCKTKHCLLVANGTVSLEMIIRALDIGYGDEVILPAYTFIATLSSILFTSAKPVFADIDRDSYCISAESAASRITEKTKAIVCVAVAGRPMDLDALSELAEKHGIYLIVDAAQAVGAVWRGTDIGKYGIAASFSCQNSKNLNCGEGGIITTDSDVLYNKLNAILNGGKSGGKFMGIGQDNGITEFQASVLDSQADKLDYEVILRERNAAYLDGRLSSLPFVSPLAADSRITVHAYHLYMLRFNYTLLEEVGADRNMILRALNAEGVPIGPGYTPLYRFQCTSSAQTKRIIGGDIDISPLPECEIASDLEGSWLTQNLLIGNYSDMDDIADAMIKIWDNIGELRQIRNGGA